MPPRAVRSRRYPQNGHWQKDKESPNAECEPKDQRFQYPSFSLPACLSTGPRAEMRTFKEELRKLIEQPIVRSSQGQVPRSSSWAWDQTQAGDAHHNPGPPKKNQRQHLVRRWSDANQAQNSSRNKSKQRPIQRYSSSTEPAAVIG